MIRKFYYCLKLLCLISAICLISCEVDDFEQLEEEKSIFPNISSRLITLQGMKNEAATYDKLMDYMNGSFEKSSGIQLDTSHIKVIDSDQFSSYNFKIKQDSLERLYLLRNFILTIVNDTTQIQHLVDYPVMSDGSIDVENTQWTRLYGEDILNVSIAKCGGSSTTWYSYEVNVPMNCGGATGNGEHGPGEECNAVGGDRAFYNTVVRWGSVTVNEPECLTIVDSGRGGGGGGTNIDQDPTGNIIILPVDPNDPDVPDLCISDGQGGCIYNSGNGPDLVSPDPTQRYIDALLLNVFFKSGITVLQNSLNLSFEIGASFTTSDHIIDGNSGLPYTIHQGSAAAPDHVTFPNFSYVTKIRAHVHYKSRTVVTVQGNISTTTTYKPIPMFSHPDIEGFNNHLVLVRDDLVSQGVDPSIIQKRLDQFSEIVVTDNGNYLLQWHGSYQNLTQMTLPNVKSSVRAERIAARKMLKDYNTNVGADPEMNIGAFLNSIAPNHQFVIHKFDLNGNITRIN